MLIDTRVDSHVHTHLCRHARGTMEEYVQAALNCGLRKLVFLEHLEIGINYFETTWLTEEDFAFYLTEGRRLQEKYAGRLAIGLGVEVGYNPRRKEELAAFLKKHSWDRVGISYHFLEIDGRHYNMVSRKKENVEALVRIGMEKVVSAYLRGLLEANDSLAGDMLCHLDAVLRHYQGVRFTDEHNRLIAAILGNLGLKGMALEVNTSGFDLRNEQFPAFGYLRQALRQGITLVAGSDAHNPGEVGRHFDRLPVLIEKAINE
jgi:histidinol-phosphatase (PHP family)